MKLFAASGLMSLGLCAAVSFAQGFGPRTEPLLSEYGRSIQHQVPGRYYEEIRSAYHGRFQEDGVDETVSTPDNDLPSPSDVPAQPTPADPNHARGGSITGSGHNYGESCLAGEQCDWNDGLVYDASCCNTGCGWFGGIYGLLMTRTDDHGETLSYDCTCPVDSILSTDFGMDDYAGGAEARIGKYLNDCWAIEGVYWGIYPDDDEATLLRSSLAGDLLTAIDFTGLVYDNGAALLDVGEFYGNTVTGAQAHRLRRNYEVHNVELNLIRNPYRRTGCIHFELLAGARFLRLNEGFIFSTDFANETFGDDLANELHYGIDVDNNLVGFQLGGRADYYVKSCFSINTGLKFGIYNNYVEQRQQIIGGNGFAYASSTGLDYNIESSDNNVAFLGELSAGASYDFGCNWRLTGGYRAVAACGVATAANQIPRGQDFYIYERVGAIDANDCLVLHGGYFGVEYNW